MSPSHTPHEHDLDDVLEGGLQAAFGAPRPADDAEQPRGVLRRLGLRRDVTRLRDVDVGADEGPLRASSELRSVDVERSSYRVLGEIARGGMGAVFRGYDGDLGRDVALKVLLDEHRDQPELCERFVEEAQVGGQLQHPGIVPVYELGVTAEGQLFFAMKLVQGRTLAALFSERSAADDSRHKLLGILEQVAHTVAYAHARGVVHRDLKPSNVMVGAFGAVQVVDWGLAKVLRHGGIDDDRRGKPMVGTVRTAQDPTREGSRSSAGSVMGTLRYMPPEQARGDVERIDERADVFALGAILCELLTGDPPCRVDGPQLRAQVVAGDFAEARARLAASGSDDELVGLTLACLESDPANRPRNAGAIAARLAQHRESLEERRRAAEIRAVQARAEAAQQRKARRLANLLLVSVLVTTGVVVGGGSSLRAQRLERLRETISTVDTALAEAAQLEGRAAARDDALAWNAARGAFARDARELRAAELLRDLEEVRVPEKRGSVGGEQRYPTDFARVAADYRATFEHHGFPLDHWSVEEALPRLARLEAPAALAAGVDEWADNLRHAGDPAGSRHLTHIANALDPDAERVKIRALLHAGDADALSQVLDDTAWTELPAPTLHLIGNALGRAEDTAQAVRVFRRLRRRDPESFSANAGLARWLYSLSDEHSAEAARYYTAALALRPENVETRHALGWQLEHAQRHREALESFREAIALRPDDAHLWAHLGGCLIALDELEEGADALRRALQLDPNDEHARNLLAYVLYRSGDVDASIEAYEELTARHADTADYWNNLGTVLLRHGRHEEAVHAYERAVELKPERADWLMPLAEALAQSGDTQTAEETLRRALASAPNDGKAHYALGRLLFNTDRKAESLPHLERAAELGSPLSTNSLLEAARAAVEKR